VTESNKTKSYRKIHVDVGLNTRILDKLNSNKNIQITSTCSGHMNRIGINRNPKISFRYLGKLTENQILIILKKIPNSNVEYSSSKTLNEFAKRHGGEGDNICGFFRIQSTKFTPEGKLQWWKDVSSVVSRLPKRKLDTVKNL